MLLNCLASSLQGLLCKCLEDKNSAIPTSYATASIFGHIEHLQVALVRIKQERNCKIATQNLFLGRHLPFVGPLACLPSTYEAEDAHEVGKLRSANFLHAFPGYRMHVGNCNSSCQLSKESWCPTGFLIIPKGLRLMSSGEGWKWACLITKGRAAQQALAPHSQGVQGQPAFVNKDRISSQWEPCWQSSKLWSILYKISFSLEIELVSYFFLSILKSLPPCPQLSFPTHTTQTHFLMNICLLGAIPKTGFL